MEQLTERPIHAFDYADYRLFLEQYFFWRKQSRPTFSFRAFNRKAGFKSPSFTSQIIKGRRNLSDISLEKMILALNLSGVEEEYFRALVKFNQARVDSEKRFWFQETQRLKSPLEDKKDFIETFVEEAKIKFPNLSDDLLKEKIINEIHRFF